MNDVLTYFINDFLPRFDAQFWKDFWPNTIANIVTAIILIPLITKVIERYQQANLYIIARTEKISSGLRVTILITNPGKAPFLGNDVFWTVFLKPPQDFDLRTVVDLTWETTNFEQEEYVTVNGLLKDPLFPGHQRELFSVNMNQISDKINYVYYYLSTSRGLVPPDVRQDDEGVVILEKRKLRSAVLKQLHQ